MAAVTAKSLAEQVIDEIMDLVTERRLQPGDRLPTEKELTELFGVGRSTVREAVCQLQNIGVLSVRQGRGTFLQEISTNTLLKNQDPLYKFIDLERDELRDVMDVAKLLEMEIVKLAVERIDDQGLQILHTCYTKHHRIKGSVSAYECDQEFHRLLAELCGNAILLLTLNSVNSFLDKYTPIIASAFEIPEYSEKNLEQHRQLILAIEDRDGERAANLMLRHLNTSQMAILASFDIFIEKRKLRLV